MTDKTSLRNLNISANDTRVKYVGRVFRLPDDWLKEAEDTQEGQGLTSQTNLGLIEFPCNASVQTGTWNEVLHIARINSEDTDPNSKIFGEIFPGRKDRPHSSSGLDGPERDSGVKVIFGDDGIATKQPGVEFTVLGSQSCVLGTANCINSPHSGWTVEPSNKHTTDTSLTLLETSQQRPKEVLDKPSPAISTNRGGSTKYTSWLPSSTSETTPSAEHMAYANAINCSPAIPQTENSWKSWGAREEAESAYMYQPQEFFRSKSISKHTKHASTLAGLNREPIIKNNAPEDEKVETRTSNHLREEILTQIDGNRVFSIASSRGVDTRTVNPVYQLQVGQLEEGVQKCGNRMVTRSSPQQKSIQGKMQRN